VGSRVSVMTADGRGTANAAFPAPRFRSASLLIYNILPSFPHNHHHYHHTHPTTNQHRHPLSWPLHASLPSPPLPPERLLVSWPATPTPYHLPSSRRPPPHITHSHPSSDIDHFPRQPPTSAPRLIIPILISITPSPTLLLLPFPPSLKLRRRRLSNLDRFLAGKGSILRVSRPFFFLFLVPSLLR
jgi:hypothetical protein